MGLHPNTQYLANAAASHVHFRHFHDPGLFSGPLKSRQEQCLDECSSISDALDCEDAACACPILAAATTSDINACDNCLNSNGYNTYSSLITLGHDVCTECYAQCSFVLTAAIESQSCTTLACFCPILQPGGANALESCASCMQSFDSAEASDLLSFVTGCGFSSAAAITSTSSTSHSTPADTSTVISNTATTTNAPTKATNTGGTVTTSSQMEGSSNGPSTPTATASAEQHSGAQTIGIEKGVWFLTLIGLSVGVVALR